MASNIKVDPTPQNSLKEEHGWRDWFAKVYNKFKSGATTSINTNTLQMTIDQGIVTSASGSSYTYTPPTGFTGTIVLATTTSITVANGIITGKTP